MASLTVPAASSVLGPGAGDFAVAEVPLVPAASSVVGLEAGDFAVAEVPGGDLAAAATEKHFDQLLIQNRKCSNRYFDLSQE